MPSLPKNAILLAIDPTSRGLSFAVLEAPAYLVSWGSREATTKTVLKKLDELLTQFNPDVLVLEDLAAEGARRRARAKREIQAMELLAFTRGLQVEWVSRLAVRDTFAPGMNKYAVAVRLAAIFPDLAEQVPRKRKAWMPEDLRMNVFDALGFAVALVERAGQHSSRRTHSSLGK